MFNVVHYLIGFLVQACKEKRIERVDHRHPDASTVAPVLSSLRDGQELVVPKRISLVPLPTVLECCHNLRHGPIIATALYTSCRLLLLLLHRRTVRDVMIDTQTS